MPLICGISAGLLLQIWDYVMPYWLESIRTEVPEEDLSELKVLLRSELVHTVVVWCLSLFIFLHQQHLFKLTITSVHSVLHRVDL